MTEPLNPLDLDPLGRLGLWLATNTGLSDYPTHEEVEETIDRLGASTIGTQIEELFADQFDDSIERAEYNAAPECRE